MPLQATTKCADQGQLGVEPTSVELTSVAGTHPDRRQPPEDTGCGPSVIGSTLIMKGELTLDEDLVIDGTFIGPISNSARRLSVTSFAKVQGDIQSASADIAGTVEGEVSGGSALILRRTAQLRGSLSADNVVVEQGTNLENAVLTGRVTCAARRRRP